MEYFEIQDGICVNVEKIDAIEEVDDTACKVYVGKRVYLSTYSYKSLLEMLKNNLVIDKVLSKDGLTERTMKKLDAVLDKAGYFAG